MACYVPNAEKRTRNGLDRQAEVGVREGRQIKVSRMDQCTPDVLERNKGSIRTNGHAALAPQDALEVERKLTEIRQVFGENYRYLIQYARNRVDSLEGAQDIVQQAFVNTLTSIERGAEIRNMSGFLHRCVHNLCINASRREPPLALDEELCLMTERSAAASAEVRDHWREVEEVVDNLAPSQRYAFLLAEVNGYGYDEIAESMGRSVESVRQLLSRARRIIRAKTDVGPEWFSGAIPVLGADQILLPERTGVDSGVINWIKGKVSEMQTWVGGNVQRSLETVVQSSAPVAAGVVAIAVATVASPPAVNEPGFDGAGQSADGAKVQVVSHLQTARTEVGETDFAPETILKPQPTDESESDARKGESEHDGDDSDRDGTDGDSADDDNSGDTHGKTGGQSGMPVESGGQAQAAGAAPGGPLDGGDGVPHDGEDTVWVDDPPNIPNMGTGISSGNETNEDGGTGIDGPYIGNDDDGGGADHNDNGNDAGDGAGSKGNGQSVEEPGSGGSATKSGPGPSIPISLKPISK